MITGYIVGGLSIALGVVLFFCAIYFSTETGLEDNAFIFFGGAFFIFIGLFPITGNYDYSHKPHNGRVPTIDSVAVGSAHIDTIKTISGKDTTIRYEIIWNDAN